MNTCWLKKIIKLGWMLIMGVSMSACSDGRQGWREEVLLHNGSKLIVTRSQSYGGRGEIEKQGTDHGFEKQGTDHGFMVNEELFEMRRMG